MEKLKEVHIYRPESALPAHYTSLEAYFRAHPPARIKEAQREIETLTGSKRSETQVREFLTRLLCFGAEPDLEPGSAGNVAPTQGEW